METFEKWTIELKLGKRPKSDRLKCTSNLQKMYR